MKKLFFAAALAIVAVGGALSSNAVTVYASGASSSQGFECSNIGTPLCTDYPVQLYTSPIPNQNTGTEVDPSDIAGLRYVN